MTLGLTRGKTFCPKEEFYYTVSFSGAGVVPAQGHVISIASVLLTREALLLASCYF